MNFGVKLLSATLCRNFVIQVGDSLKIKTLNFACAQRERLITQSR